MRARTRRQLPTLIRMTVGIVALAVLVVVLYVIIERAAKNTTGGPPPPHTATEAQVKATSDVFGISYLEPTLPGGTYWISQWGRPRTFDGVDPQDSWFDAAHGSATYTAGGGRLEVSGDIPRMYVHDPQLQRQWRDVEITMYFMRVADSGIPFTGMTAVARANHLTTEQGSADACDTRGYGGRFRFDGHTDFEKETSHPHNQAFSNKVLFPGGMPRNQWIGYKYLVFDEPDGVHLQLWADLTDGLHGGDWHLVNSMVDNGHVFGQVPCAPGIDPQMELTSSPHRAGSESGRPNVSVYFRADGIAKDGLVYKWGSIREIKPRPVGVHDTPPMLGPR